jgi:hypothetical protein
MCFEYIACANIGMKNTCKGTSKGHLTTKIISRKYQTVCCPKRQQRTVLEVQT